MSSSLTEPVAGVTRPLAGLRDVGLDWSLRFSYYLRTVESKDGV